MRRWPHHRLARRERIRRTAAAVVSSILGMLPLTVGRRIRQIRARHDGEDQRVESENDELKTSVPEGVHVTFDGAHYVDHCWDEDHGRLERGLYSLLRSFPPRHPITPIHNVRERLAQFLAARHPPFGESWLNVGSIPVDYHSDPLFLIESLTLTLTLTPSLGVFLHIQAIPNRRCRESFERLIRSEYASRLRFLHASPSGRLGWTRDLGTSQKAEAIEEFMLTFQQQVVRLLRRHLRVGRLLDGPLASIEVFSVDGSSTDVSEVRHGFWTSLLLRRRSALAHTDGTATFYDPSTWRARRSPYHRLLLPSSIQADQTAGIGHGAIRSTVPLETLGCLVALRETCFRHSKGLLRIRERLSGVLSRGPRLAAWSFWPGGRWGARLHQLDFAASRLGDCEEARELGDIALLKNLRRHDTPPTRENTWVDDVHWYLEHTAEETGRQLKILRQHHEISIAGRIQRTLLLLTLLGLVLATIEVVASWDELARVFRAP